MSKLAADVQFDGWREALGLPPATLADTAKAEAEAALPDEVPMATKAEATRDALLAADTSVDGAAQPPTDAMEVTAAPTPIPEAHAMGITPEAVAEHGDVKPKLEVVEAAS